MLKEVVDFRGGVGIMGDASSMDHSPLAIAFAPPSAMRLALRGRQVRASAFGGGDR